jgi:hypothetical protein
MTERWQKEWTIWRKDQHGRSHPDRTGICIRAAGLLYYFYHDWDPAITGKILANPFYENLRPLTFRKLKTNEQAPKKRRRTGPA